MMKSRALSHRKAFTLVELMVSVAIFVFMTVLLVAKYGNFNSDTLLTNAAYDVALAIRTAQTYGISVRNNGTNNFGTAYGIYINMGFNSSYGCNTPSPNTIIFFSNPLTYQFPHNYNCQISSILSTYTLQQGIKVVSICDSEDEVTCAGNAVDAFPDIMIAFIRPNPDAIIHSHQNGAYFINYPNGQPVIVWCVQQPALCGGGGLATDDTQESGSHTFVKIKLASGDGSQSRTVKVYNNGQISVVD